MMQVVEKPVIKKIVLDIGGKELELSLDDARNLHRALADLLNEPKITVSPYYPWGTGNPYPPYQPTITFNGVQNELRNVTAYYTDTNQSLMQ